MYDFCGRYHFVGPAGIVLCLHYRIWTKPNGFSCRVRIAFRFIFQIIQPYLTSNQFAGFHLGHQYLMPCERARHNLCFLTILQSLFSLVTVRNQSNRSEFSHNRSDSVSGFRAGGLTMQRKLLFTYGFRPAKLALETFCHLSHSAERIMLA